MSQMEQIAVFDEARFFTSVMDFDLTLPWRSFAYDQDWIEALIHQRISSSDMINELNLDDLDVISRLMCDCEELIMERLESGNYDDELISMGIDEEHMPQELNDFLAILRHAQRENTDERIRRINILHKVGFKNV